jgi:regulatory protein
MPSDRDDTRPAPPPKKPPRKISRSFLMNAAVYYLQRFATSREGLRQVLARKVRRSLAHHGGDAEAAAAWVEEVLDTLQRQGVLNDAAFAEARARSLAARGMAARSIRLKLAQKGVDRDLVDAALAALAEEVGLRTGLGEEASPDLTAAVAYARRRRLGPYRMDPELRAARRDKDLASLARQGFSLDIALKVVTADDLAALEAEAGRV